MSLGEVVYIKKLFVFYNSVLKLFVFLKGTLT